jgi:hypothetical protein
MFFVEMQGGAIKTPKPRYMEVHGGGYSGTTKLSSGRLVLHFARNHFFRLIPQNGYYTGLAGYAVPAMLEMALLPFREKKNPASPETTAIQYS